MAVQTASEMNRPAPAGLRNSALRSNRTMVRSVSMESPCPLVLASNRDHSDSVRSMSSSWLDEQLRRIGAAPPASAADQISAHR